MAMALDMRSADFERRFAALLATKRETGRRRRGRAAIFAAVRARGDAALVEHSVRFDASIS